MDIKELWPLMQTVTGGIILAAVLVLLLTKKLVVGSTYEAKCAEAEDWKKRYLDLLGNRKPST